MLTRQQVQGQMWDLGNENQSLSIRTKVKEPLTQRQWHVTTHEEKRWLGKKRRPQVNADDAVVWSVNTGGLVCPIRRGDGVAEWFVLKKNRGQWRFWKLYFFFTHCIVIVCKNVVFGVNSWFLVGPSWVGGSRDPLCCLRTDDKVQLNRIQRRSLGCAGSLQTLPTMSGTRLCPCAHHCASRPNTYAVFFVH